MQSELFFYQAFIYLVAAVVAVPIAKRFGLGSVLGYLIAGIAIGPLGLRLVGDEGKDVMHFAEFGVVMMLFLVGLELEPTLLWRMRGPIVGLGTLQVAITASLIVPVAMQFGLQWQSAVATGIILAFSSTAIVLQILNEKGLTRTDAGQNGFAVLLFQDVAVIPVLALLPLLSWQSASDARPHATINSTAWLEALPSWAHTLVLLGAVSLVVGVGKFLAGPAFRLIAKTHLRELFTAAALLMIIGITLLMTKVGLSPALGTFLAGVVLANCEYRHELVINIEPFKGLLLGLFFIAVGASIDFKLLTANPALIGGLVVGIIALKFVVLFLLGRIFRMSLDQNLLFAFALAQGGEFSFVLFSFAIAERVIAPHIAKILIVVIALTMTLTPLLLLINEKVFQPRFGTKERQEHKPVTIEAHNPVIIAGFGRFGNIVGRLLAANGVSATVLDIDSDHVDMLRRLGFNVFYGDASRYDLLRAAGADQAKLLVLAIDNPEKILEIVHTSKKHFPHLQILARAINRRDAYDLLDAGIDHVYRESLDTSLRLGVDALRMLGFRAYCALRSARTFRQYDEASLRELALVRHDSNIYMSQARQRIEELEDLLKIQQEKFAHSVDEAWDTDSMSNRGQNAVTDSSS